MNSIRNSILGIAIILLVLVGIVAVPAALARNGEAKVEVLKVDVSEDMTRFVYDTDIVFEEDGFPAHGSTFITQGYIYPEGTLDGTDGTLPDGSPEYPDKVIGEWTCRGTFIGDGAHATEGAWVITTQVLNFGDELGENTIVLEGYESAVINQYIKRALTGGTGRYRSASGEAEQALIGFNASEGVNLRFVLHIQK